MSRYLLGVVTQSLQDGNLAQRPIITRTIGCKWALLEFYMYAQDNSHNVATFSYIEDALRRFHTYKNVILLGRAGQEAKPKPNAMRTELVKKWKVDEEINAQTWMPSKKRHKVKTWRDYIIHGIDVWKVRDADFNIPRIHLMSHWVKQIRHYGKLQQYSAKRRGNSNETYLKDGWNASNHNLNYLPQGITFQNGILYFEIGELNLEALAQRRESRAAACKVLPSSDDLAAP